MFQGLLLLLLLSIIIIIIKVVEFKKIKSVTYSYQGSHAGQLDFRNWLANGSTTG